MDDSAPNATHPLVVAAERVTTAHERLKASRNLLKHAAVVGGIAAVLTLVITFARFGSTDRLPFYLLVGVMLCWLGIHYALLKRHANLGLEFEDASRHFEDLKKRHQPRNESSL